MAEEALLRQRRNLITFSIGLILINLLDANFGESGSIIAGSISFPKENGYILLWATWIGFFYFLWRYTIFGGNRALNDIKIVFAEFLKNDMKYRTYLDNKYSDEVKEEIKENQTSTGLVTTKISKYDVQNCGSHYAIQITFNGNITGTNYNVNRAHATTFIKEPIHGLRILWKTISKHSGFSEYMLPLLLAWWAFCFLYIDIWVAVFKWAN